MADYASLWTSSRDKEFQQIKKVKQLTERHLAMHLSNVEKTHKRSIKKTRDQIRDNMTLLESLEQEKEKRARHLLAIYLKHQRSKEAAMKWSARFKAMTARVTGSPFATRIQNKTDPRPSKLTSSLQAFAQNPTSNKQRDSIQSEISLPRIKLNDSELDPTETSDHEDALTDPIERVERANSVTSNGSNTTNNFGNNNSNNALDVTKHGRSKGRDGSPSPKPAKRLISSQLPIMRASNGSTSPIEQRRISQSSSGRMSLASIEKDGSSRSKLPKNRRPKARMADTMMLQPMKDHKVYMTHTFPYVYHSEGEKPCPRYGLFRECTDYNPYVTLPTQRKASKVDTSRKASLATRTATPASIGTLSKRSSLQKAGIAIKIINALNIKDQN